MSGLRARGIGVAVATVLAGGCMATLGTALPSQPDGASLQVLADIRTSKGFEAQALVSPYVTGDIDHVRMKLFTVANGMETEAKTASNAPIEATVASSSLTATLTFTYLKRDTTYRVRAYAYKAPAESVRNKISQDAASYVDVAVSSDDRPALARVPVQLDDKAFAGEATTSLLVDEGLMSTPGPEAVTFPTPTPGT